MTENMKKVIKIISENTEVSNKLETIEDEESVYEFFKDLNPEITLKDFKEGLEELFSNHEELQNEDLLYISGGEMKSKALNKTMAGVLAALSIGSSFPSKTSAYQAPNQTSKTYSINTKSKSFLSNKKYLIGVGAAVLAAIGIPTAVLTIKHFTKKNNEPNKEEHNEDTSNQVSAKNESTPAKKQHSPLISPIEKISGFTGIRNEGSTCYFNSGLQLLFQIPEIRNNNFNNLSSDEVLKTQLNGIKTLVNELQKQKNNAEQARNTFINGFISKISGETELTQAVRKFDLQSCKNKIQELESKRKDLYSNKNYGEATKVSREIDVYKIIECLIQLFSTDTVLKDEEKIDKVCSLFNIIDGSEEKLNSVLNILLSENEATRNSISSLFKDIQPQYENLKNNYSDTIVKLTEIKGNENIIETEEEKEQNRKNLENLSKIMTKLSNKEAPNDIMKNILTDHNVYGQEDVSRVIESYFTGIPRELVSIKNLEVSNPEAIDKNLLEKIPSKYKLIGINKYLDNKKIIGNMNVPETIEDVHGQKYELASVSIYSSGSGKYGHYYAYSKNDNGDWYEINDSTITRKGSYENIKNDVFENARLALYRPVNNK